MIYFDHAATTPLSEEVYDIYTKYLKECFGNPSSAHKVGFTSFEMLEKARTQIGKYFDVSKDEVIFTSGATESNNLGIKGVINRNKTKRHTIVTTTIEHPSVLNIFKEYEGEYDVKYLSIDKSGKFNEKELETFLNEDTLLVSTMYVNNETGLIIDIEKIKQYKQKFNFIFHVDATQAIGKIPTDFNGVDLISLSAHKLNGLKGSGVLIKKKNVLLNPLFQGGGQEQGIRPGTSNVPTDIALAKTLRIAFEQQAARFKYVKPLYDELYRYLTSNEEIVVTSIPNNSPFIINFSLVNFKSSVIVEGLSKHEIMVSTKSACSSKKNSASYVIKSLGYDDNIASNSIRISLSHLNTMEEVMQFENILNDLLATIKRKE